MIILPMATITLFAVLNHESKLPRQAD